MDKAMTLFPAYAPELSENTENTKYEYQGCNESLVLEAQLLASDKEEDGDNVTSKVSVGASSTGQNLSEENEFYVDRKLDYANLRVTTLYYPGRPQYNTLPPRQALGDLRRSSRLAASRRRYYAQALGGGGSGGGGGGAPDAAELAQRTRVFRDMLAKAPHDRALWLRFIDFQERCASEAAALAAAEEAARSAGGARVRAALYRARAALPPHERLRLLHGDLARATGAGGAEGAEGSLVTELWLRVMSEAAAAGGAELDAATGAALAATRAHALAYPHILYAYGAYLRAAGLSERLVLLIELVTSMNFPPAAFPPPHDPQRLADQERTLHELEDKIVSSGLPLSTVWVRVERARAAAHWRPAAGADTLGADTLGADPQRAPLAADVAELLRPVADADAAALLLVHVLRLAKVPLLPCSEYLSRAAQGGASAAGDAAEAEGGEALLALLRCARRLPPAHPAHPAHPAQAEHCHRLVAHFLDPPHYFTDDAGYLSWVRSLWDACCAWATGWRRTALLCWRLRWLHALALLHAAGAPDTRRLRAEARAALKRWGGAEPLAFSQFARLELAAGDARAARRAAAHAARAALADAGAPPPRRLHAARALAELGGAAAAWATVCAALGRPLPSDADLCAPPPPDVLQRALLECEAQCEALEREFEQDDDAAESGECGADVLAAMLPDCGEWAAARARLAPPARRAVLLRQARAAAALPPRSRRAARYWEQAACALVLAAAADHRLGPAARALAPLFPHSALLALACSGAPLWAWDMETTQEDRLRTLTYSAGTHRAALAQLVPPLLRAAAAEWEAGAAERVAAASARAGRRGAGGALLLAVRLEAEARAPHARPAHALLAALDRLPHHKWLAVRGAAWCSSQAPALADVLLERQLRIHALLDELTPPPNNL